MTQAIITTVKKDSITLPKTWKGSKVFLRVTGNTATITKLGASEVLFTADEIKVLRKLGRNVPQNIVRKALKK
jgi:hypothetical protein